MLNKNNLSYNETLNKLKNYCVYQDRCHHEIEQKMYEFILNEEEKENIIIYLIQENYLNEERFTISFIRGKFYQKKWGKIKIKNELKLKKIPEKLIIKCFNEIDEEDYIETLKKLYNKKFNSLNDHLILIKKRKTFTYLLSKGYESEFIQSIAFSNENY